MSHVEILDESVDPPVLHIQVSKSDGGFFTFPAVEGNPHYEQWLEEGNTLTGA